jgi:hypothetical protein
MEYDFLNAFETKNQVTYIMRKILILLLASIILLPPTSVQSDNETNPAMATDTVCRFGITSVYGSEGYDVESLGVGSYLDWGAVNNPTLPEGVEYIRVLRLRDDLYSNTRDNVAAWVEANPGSVWIIGNEPDTTYGQQDALVAEVYADRYYELAKIIRHHDPTARIGFGPVVQPTPIRIRYLTLAWNRLVADTGGALNASSLIDIWTIHAFILNEQRFSWGTGVPPGFEDDYEDAFIIELPDGVYKTYSIDIFQQWIFAFREWMASIGEREKPLWITEYGSLFPPVDPIGGPDYYNVSDANTAAFMLQTFDFMLSASDEQTGLPADSNQLVQRWYWFSLNAHRYAVGGSIYNPDYPDYSEYGESVITPVGDAFIAYQQSHLQEPDLSPTNLVIVPKSYNSDRSRVDYRLDITISNNNFDDGTCAQVWVYDGNPNEENLIAGPLPSSMIKSNYGTGLISVFWSGVEPMTQHQLYVVVEPIGISDTYPENNQAVFSVFTDLPKLHFLPLVGH